MDFDVINTRINPEDTVVAEVNVVLPVFPEIGLLKEKSLYEGLNADIYQQANTATFQVLKDLMQEHGVWFHRHLIRTNNMIADGIEVEVPLEAGRDLGFKHTVCLHTLQRRETDPSTMPVHSNKKSVSETLEEFADLYTKVGLQPYYDSYEICKQLFSTASKNLGDKKVMFACEFTQGQTSLNVVSNYTREVAPKEFLILIIALSIKKFRK